MAQTMRDFSFRLDRSENIVLTKNYDYMKGIIALLFGMRPGADPYNPEMGLDLPGKRFTHAMNNTRDSDYEQQITDQFAKYTDMLAISPIAWRSDGRYLVTFALNYKGEFYNVSIGVTDNQLGIVIEERDSGVKNI